MNGLLNVVRAELFKALRKRRTYVLAGLQWVLLPILTLLIGYVIQVNVTGSFLDEDNTVATTLQAFASPFGLTQVSLALPTLISPPFLLIVIALIAALFIGDERTQNMWKTVLVAQPDRRVILTGKLLTAILLLGLFLLGSFFSSILFGSIGMIFLPTTFAGEWLELARLYALQWAFGIAAVVFAFMMLWLIRNVVLGIVMIFFLPPLLEGLYGLYAITVGFQPINRFNVLLQSMRLLDSFRDLPRYFFTSNLYTPSREPWREIARLFGEDMGASNPVADLIGLNLTFQHSAVVLAVYTLIFGAILYWSFTRRDIA